ncbi:hypothetical protein [Nostoc sp. KVJ20]|uniref:hypothetical protein n=1 Tax=Nostoc sp. KVJ20 TaxID=457944 RepID=UPI00114D1D50|nr:hypothetical protein [Nostoc sp. KVJ20]
MLAEPPSSTYTLSPTRSLLTVALPKSPKAVLHWALGVGEEAIARSHATLYSPGGPIRHWRLGIG